MERKKNHSIYIRCSLGACFLGFALFTLSLHYIYTQWSLNACSCSLHTLSPSADLNKTSFTRSSPSREETHRCRRGSVLYPCRYLRHIADSGGPPTLLPPCRIVRRSDLPPPTSRQPSGISSSKRPCSTAPAPHVSACASFSTPISSSKAT